MNQIATFPRDTVAALRRRIRRHDPSRPVPNPLPKLLTGEDLPIEDSEHLFERLVLGKLEPAEIAGMLIALRMKGETAEEMIGAAQALSAAALPFDRPDYLYADCCGTGGDGSGLINVSTATAFVAVACGLPIAKHGNRSVSSRCGSRRRARSRRREDRHRAREGSARCSTRPVSASSSLRPITRA